MDRCGLSAIPEPIFKLSKLESLNLDHNRLDHILQSLVNLISLKELHLDEYQVPALNLFGSFISFSMDLCKNMKEPTQYKTG